MSKEVIVDASGLSCPQAVLLTRRALERAGQGRGIVLVDLGTSRDNCSRIAQKSGWRVQVEPREEGGYRLVMCK